MVSFKRYAVFPVETSKLEMVVGTTRVASCLDTGHSWKICCNDCIRTHSEYVGLCYRHEEMEPK